MMSLRPFRMTCFTLNLYTSGVSSTQVAVFGLGYVGCVTAACLAKLGHRVVGVDRDEHKVRSVLDGRAPFFEPGLEGLVREGVAASRLTATTSVSEALDSAEIALICVGTPSEKNGNLGLDQLRKVTAEIRASGKRPIVAVRSTVFPGTCEEVAGAGAVSNPEFLREGTAVRDFMEPSLVVVGGEDATARKRVAELYAPLGVEPCLVSLRTAEMIKYACNAFHAVKISFANEVGTLAAEMGVSGDEVMATLCRDDKLNISAAYLKPGFAFGGSCLPKDLRALVYRAARLDLRLPLLESVLPSNDAHLGRAIAQVLDLPASRIGVFGLAFKENTDDLRESPVIALLEQLIGKGRDVQVFDPQIRIDQIYGSNRSFVFRQIPHIEKLVTADFEELARWADHIVIAQKPGAEYARLIESTGVETTNLVAAVSVRREAIESAGAARRD